MATERPEREAETSELGAAEAVTPGAFGPAADEKPKDAVICPYCDRPVEAGFKFCDWCGKPLTKPPEEKKPAEPVEKKEEKPPAPAPAEPKRRFSLRRRRGESVAAQSEAILEQKAKEGTPAPVVPPPRVEPAPPRAVPPPPPRIEPAAATRPIVTPPPRPTTPPPPARVAPPAVAPERAKRGVTAGGVVLYLVHLVIAFAAGALVLAAIAVIVALTSEGERTFLEMRGLPVFTGVAVSVAVFAVFRGTAPGAGWGRGARAAAIVGMLVLVGAGAYVYRPPVLSDAQEPLERLAGVWSDADEQAVETLKGDLLTWNDTVDGYQRVVAAIIRNEITVEEFRGVARSSEAELEDTIDAMDASALSASNERLRDALSSLVDAYEAQLAALKAVSRGILQGDFQSLQGGDSAYKQAQAAAVERFEERVEPLLERAGFDVESFARAVGAE